MRYLRFHFAIEINFECEGGGVETGAAISALSQMALNLTSYLRCEAPFQILTNQSNCCLTSHTHDSASRNWVSPVNTVEHATDQSSLRAEINVYYRFKKSW